MACGRPLDEIVTAFMLNTCRPRPQPSIQIQAALHCGSIIALVHHDQGAPRTVDDGFIPLITGSVAEFYIEPMLSHVGDIDVMFHHSDLLAIPRGHPPPTQLPAEFHN